MIETARLIQGSEARTAEGITGALRCTLELPDGSRRAAILKRGPLAEVAAEAYAAVLLRAWGLPVPQPFLVPEADGSLAFASADMSYPSLRQRMGLDRYAGPQRQRAEVLACLVASSLRTAPLAAAADEAIDNRDRNLGNILWDGAAEAWIDHAYAFGLGGQPDANKVCTMAMVAGNAETLKASAVAQALAMDRQAVAEVAQALAGSVDAQGMADEVSRRIAGLAGRILARFPQPADLLSGL